jgi:hypothetical protein
MGTSDTALSITGQASDPWEQGQLRHALAAGMGPLLYRAIGDRIKALPEDWRNILRSAELTAMVRHGARVETALQVIDVCARLGVELTLLKGISISEQVYPEAHLRPMGDVDILVPPDSCNAVESALIELDYFPDPGYQRTAYSNHGVPLRDPQTGVWVEIHSALFRRDTRLGCFGGFDQDALSAKTVDTEFHGRPVKRFTDEMQLLYLAASWVQDISAQGLDATLLIPLLDAVYLLNASTQELDRDRLLGWTDNESALASLYLLVTYLSRHALWVPDSELLSRLGASQRIIGSLELRIVHAMLDRYLLLGKPFTRAFHSARVWETLFGPGRGPTKLVRLPWGILFPSTSPDRFTLRYQLERVPRLLRRLGIMSGR